MRLRKLLRLRFKDQIFLAATWMVVASVRLGLSIIRYRMLARLLPTGGRAHAPGWELRRTAWAVTLAARYVPAASCLTQALAGQTLLALRGYETVVRIGVGTRPEGGIRAHAWLVSGEEVVLGGRAESIADFKPLLDLQPRTP
jgi:hypothetical protein